MPTAESQKHNAGALPTGSIARVAPATLTPTDRYSLFTLAARWRASRLPGCSILADAVDAFLAVEDTLRQENAALRAEVELLHAREARTRSLVMALALDTLSPDASSFLSVRQASSSPDPETERRL